MEERNEVFEAIPILDSQLTDEEINTFSVKHKEGQGLVEYLYGKAEVEEEYNLMRTYIVRDMMTNEVAGYFSLKAGLFTINEHSIETTDFFNTIPGVELANFAVNNTYVVNHGKTKGYGHIIFQKLIMPIVIETARKVGVKMLYIFSLPYDSLMKRYEEYGFCRLPTTEEERLHKRIKPAYDIGCIFMYQEL